MHIYWQASLLTVQTEKNYEKVGYLGVLRRVARYGHI